MPQLQTGRLPFFSRRLLNTAATLTLHSTAFDAGIDQAEDGAQFIEATEKDPSNGPFLACDPVRLIQCARIASCFPDLSSLTQLTRRGQITRFLTTQAEAEKLAGFLEDALNVWAHDLSLPALKKISIKAVATSGSKLSIASKDVSNMISKALASGQSVVLLHDRTVVLPSEIAAVSKEPTPLTPLTTMALSEVLGLIYRTAPSPEALQTLTSEQLDGLGEFAIHHAFGETTPDDVITRLAAIDISHSSPDVPLERLEGLHLNGQQTEALNRIVRDVARFRSGEIEWRDASSSLLLFGSPGNGKTLAARSLAGSAGLPYHILAYGDVQAAGNLGDTLRAMTKTAEEAMAGAPCVLHFEELDGFGSRFSSDKHGQSYRRAVITHLLALIDRLRAHPGIVLIGCTNALDEIDPAIRRSGRFDQHIHIGPPARRSIISILSDLLPYDDLDLDVAADRLLGCSGSDIVAVARATKSAAQDAGLEISDAHLNRAVAPFAPAVDMDALKRIAVHEAGHLLVGHLLNLPAPIHASVTPRGGEIVFPKPFFDTEDTIHARIRTLLAGRCAEILTFGDASSGAGAGPDSDLAQATALALDCETRFGMGAFGLLFSPFPNAAHAPAWLQQQLRKTLEGAADEVTDLLHLHRSSLSMLARQLLKARELDAPALKALLDRVPLPDRMDPANDNVIHFRKRHDGLVQG